MKRSKATETFESDWAMVVSESTNGTLQISTSPRDALSSEKFEDVLDTYMSNGAYAGEERARKVFREIISDKLQETKSLLSKIQKQSRNAELEQSEKRCEALFNKVECESGVFAENMISIKLVLDMTYEEISKLVGISHSSIHKAVTIKRIPKITSLDCYAIGMGVPPVMLRADFDTLRCFRNMIGDIELLDEWKDVEFKKVTSKMEKLREENVEEWLSTVGEAVRMIEDTFDSNGAYLGAIIGRHHGHELGGLIGAYAGRKMSEQYACENVGGFSFPSKHIKWKIEQRLLN